MRVGELAPCRIIDFEGKVLRAEQGREGIVQVIVWP